MTSACREADWKVGGTALAKRCSVTFPLSTYCGYSSKVAIKSTIPTNCMLIVEENSVPMYVVEQHSEVNQAQQLNFKDTMLPLGCTVNQSLPEL